MSPGNEMIPASRRVVRASTEVAASAARSGRRPAPPPRKPRWSRRRGVLGVFAAFAAVGFAAAYVGPMGAAFAEPETVSTTSLFAEAVDGAQTIDQAAEAPEITLQRDSYAVYVKPKPKPKPVVGTASTGGGWTPPFVKPDPGSAKAIAYEMVKARGWSDDEFACLVALWNRESGWRVNAHNKSSGAYGIPQALPGTKMASAGADWQTNATTQIKWGLGYIKGRYGTPCGAWAHSQRTGWY